MWLFLIIVAAVVGIVSAGCVIYQALHDKHSKSIEIIDERGRSTRV